MDDPLSCIYGCGTEQIEVFVPFTQQQDPGTLDCGIFAIANIVEFCRNGYKELEKQLHSWNYDMLNSRKHLVACKSKKLLPFPKVSLQYANKLTWTDFQ